MKRCLQRLDRGCSSDRYRTKKLSQKSLETLYRGPSFLIAERYAQHCVFVCVAMTYSTGMPILYLIACLSFIITCVGCHGCVGCDDLAAAAAPGVGLGWRRLRLQGLATPDERVSPVWVPAIRYWVDKYLLLTLYRSPPHYTDEFSGRARTIMPLAIVMHLCMGIWTLGCVGGGSGVSASLCGCSCADAPSVRPQQHQRVRAGQVACKGNGRHRGAHRRRRLRSGICAWCTDV